MIGQRHRTPAKYDNMHYVKCAMDQETITSHRPSTPQRLKDER
jgi:hypothetical protein